MPRAVLKHRWQSQPTASTLKVLGKVQALAAKYFWLNISVKIFQEKLHLHSYLDFWFRAVALFSTHQIFSVLEAPSSHSHFLILALSLSHTPTHRLTHTCTHARVYAHSHSPLAVFIAMHVFEILSCFRVSCFLTS